MPNVIKFPLIAVEDVLINIGALTKFALFTLENTDDHELARLKSELVTMVYLIKDQVDIGNDGLSANARQNRTIGA